MYHDFYLEEITDSVHDDIILGPDDAIHGHIHDLGPDVRQGNLVRGWAWPLGLLGLYLAHLEIQIRTMVFTRTFVCFIKLYI